VSKKTQSSLHGFFGRSAKRPVTQTCESTSTAKKEPQKLKRAYNDIVQKLIDDTKLTFEGEKKIKMT